MRGDVKKIQMLNHMGMKLVTSTNHTHMPQKNIMNTMIIMGIMRVSVVFGMLGMVCMKNGAFGTITNALIGNMLQSFIIRRER